VLDANTGSLIRSFTPFGASWASGISVAHGDLDGDGVPEVVAGAGSGGAPRVIAFDLRTGAVVASFFAYDSSFRDGVNVAVGDVDGDGLADIITGAGNGGAAHVKVFRGGSLTEVASFFAYDSSFRDGVNVAVGDVDGDGKADIITGAAGQGAAHVKIFDGGTGVERLSFFAFDSTARGVRVAATDLTGDGMAELVVGTGAGVPPQVKVFNGTAAVEEESFDALDIGFTGGVSVG